MTLLRLRARLLLAAAALATLIIAIACAGATEPQPLIPPPIGPDSVPVDTTIGPTGPTAAQLSAAEPYTCLLGKSGHVWCWGRYGGTPGAAATESPPTRVTPFDGSLRFVAISAGTAACGLTADGRLFCWGQNLYGEVGDGTNLPRALPTPVATNLRFIAVAAGTYVTCAIARAGAAYCWGRGDYGAVGNGGSAEGTTYPLPVAVAGAHRFRSLVGGWLFCGVTDSSATMCWGRSPGSFDGSSYSMPGDCGAIYYSAFQGNSCTTPTKVSASSNFVSLASGTIGSTMCALDGGGVASCWGDGWLGTLGNGQAGGGVHAVVPVTVTTALAYQQLVVGASHVCGLTGAGSAYCWGNNFAGTLGLGIDGTGSTGIPVSARPSDAVVGGHQFVQLAAGAYHTCGIAVHGDVWCWGAGSGGQLGRSSSAGNASAPIRVAITYE